jgi:hypothetical protein
MSYNDITGDKLKSKTGDVESFSKGFDAIDWGAKSYHPVEQEDEPNQVNVPYNWAAGWQQGEFAL